MTAPIHATNAWNPTGRNLLPVPGTRLFYTHADALSGPRTFVLLGTQQHLTFVADLEGHVDPTSLRSLLIDRFGLYPHLIDEDPAPGLPHVFEPREASAPNHHADTARPSRAAPRSRSGPRP